MTMNPRVMIVCGGFRNEKETSITRALRKQWSQWQAAESPWLDLKIKLALAEPLIAAKLHGTRGPRYTREVQEFFAHRENLDTPELTEVVLATALRDAGLPFARASVDDVFARAPAFERALAQCACVFLSTTLLRDISELEPIITRLRRPGLRIVIGGALTGLLARDWAGLPGIDIVAVGYGEWLTPALAQWIRSGFVEITPPVSGRLERRAHSTFVWSGTAPGRSLDALPSPDWALAEEMHGRRFGMVYYESVRGCPYRCSFCNYPYLFDDTRFRYKSAQRIADDWARIAGETGARYITCLDSLFTVPRQRLATLCNLLVQRGIGVQWLCYARADDLAEPGVAAMMREAGAVQVQIGIESGDQGQLDNMDKQCSVAANLDALVNCREAGLTSVVSLIVGFPGETARTLETTYDFLAKARPDFYFLATFSTRAFDVPVLNAANRARFGLTTQGNRRSVAPYWAHATMSCTEAGNHARALHQRLMRDRVSLNAALFYAGLLRFQPAQREALLDYQQALMRPGLLLKTLDWANAWVDRRLKRDVERWMRTTDAQAPTLANLS